ncbi:hypothetical protein OO007_11305 [Cocleimonas sp. KMM 6892]|uniref:hypothetical protein n=1 Tax=unclassified Cocleimonas TaxID=2639732 RepID=UPI002DBE03F5|nr:MULTISPECIES: hypothetical protein [unclassified Cocleimonas]MEB8432817.1 hypothetical protein [Cocleimonas sp. KMM 6892]MEC4715676.1 hypothetical protein [Cocleimonas sp. KMM 6895]MEC4744706.1 hypothetical protein [Cocleimonas sp. KMM 6896]
MNDFILYSIIGSVVLTVLLNALPLLFPKASDKLRQKIEEYSQRNAEQKYDPDQPDENKPKINVFFPWKAMLLGSLILTVLINLIAWLSR